MEKINALIERAKKEGDSSTATELIHLITLLEEVRVMSSGGWIPVSEKLPHNSREVQVTRLDGTVSTAMYFSKDLKWVGSWSARPNDIIAWKNLSEPYVLEGE